MNELVLVVEDELDVAEVLRYNLERAQYRVLVVPDGQAAVQAVRAHAPSIMLLDIMLPELNGWEVCRIVRDSADGKNIPIIMLTALADEDSRVRGLSLGADDFIAKPFSVGELVQKVHRWTERHRDAIRLHQRQQEQEVSMKYLVHELKNTVNVIGGYSELAGRRDNPQRYLKTISSAAAHADSLLNDASLLVRLEAGSARLERASVDINELLWEAIELVRDAAGKRGIELVVDNDSPSLIAGSATAVKQVLVNLLSNAIKYNRDDGRVTVLFDDADGRIDVCITDEGMGIAQRELSRIFDKFYRVPGSERVKGVGLGLYIVRLMAEAMGGCVTVTSRIGLGSTFTVSLPKAEGTEQTVATRGPEHAAWRR